MRIAIDAHTLNGPHQGVRTYVENIAKEAAALAPDVELVLLVDRLIARPEDWPDNIRLVEWGGGRLFRLTVGARRQMQRLGCRVFHCAYFLPLVPMPNPLVVIHDLLPESHPQFFSRKFALAARLGFRNAARRARHLFTPSEYTRQNIIDLYGVPPEQVSITPCAVDAERFAHGAEQAPSLLEASLQPQDYMLMVGRFDPRKDHATVIDAYAQVFSKRPNLPRLVIAGSYGPSEQEIRTKIAALKLEQQILVLKNVSGALLPTLYAHALCTISASLGEGFGIPMLEAMAAGSPVICADNTAQTEVVKGYGLMFETASVSSLSDAMQQMLDDADLRAELRAKGHQRARSYSWRQGAEEFIRQARRAEAD